MIIILKDIYILYKETVKYGSTVGWADAAYHMYKIEMCFVWQNTN